MCILPHITDQDHIKKDRNKKPSWVEYEERVCGLVAVGQ